MSTPGTPPDSTGSTAGTGSTRRWTIGAVAALVALAITSVVTWVVWSEADPADAPSTVPVTVPRAAPPTVPNPVPDDETGSAPQLRVTGRWPDPPIDHDPHVLGRPGNGPLVTDGEGITLLYVNSIGRPTVLDLGSGDRQELDIASVRRFDRFDIESGHVVSVSERDRDEVGPSAITVRVHRPALFGLSAWQPLTPGIDLCLGAVCPQLVAVADTPSGSDQRIERLDPAADPAIALLLSGASGHDGRFDTVLLVGGAAQIPTPGTGPVWMIREP